MTGDNAKMIRDLNFLAVPYTTQKTRSYDSNYASPSATRISSTFLQDYTTHECINTVTTIHK